MALWNGQRSADPVTPAYLVELRYGRPKKFIDGYIDYANGRAIMADLTGDFVDPYLYERDLGPGRFAQIIEALRAKGKPRAGCLSRWIV